MLNGRSLTIYTPAQENELTACIDIDHHMLNRIREALEIAHDGEFSRIAFNYPGATLYPLAPFVADTDTGEPSQPYIEVSHQSGQASVAFVEQMPEQLKNKLVRVDIPEELLRSLYACSRNLMMDTVVLSGDGAAWYSSKTSPSITEQDLHRKAQVPIASQGTTEQVHQDAYHLVSQEFLLSGVSINDRGPTPRPSVSQERDLL